MRGKGSGPCPRAGLGRKVVEPLGLAASYRVP
jgi:hypothetical protein